MRRLAGYTADDIVIGQPLGTLSADVGNALHERPDCAFILTEKRLVIDWSNRDNVYINGWCSVILGIIDYDAVFLFGVRCYRRNAKPWHGHFYVVIQVDGVDVGEAF